MNCSIEKKVFEFAILVLLDFIVKKSEGYVEYSSILNNIETVTEFGKLLGTRQQVNFNTGEGSITNTIDEWLGVPFGKAERWQDPTFPDKWDGVRPATEHGPACPQVHYYFQTTLDLQEEDCLVLNIHSPHETASNTLYPVMVFIHGGSYEEGSGNRYNGLPLATFGVVVVTINYRLAQLGFLTTGDDVLPGNYGLKDQILALKWINKYIHYFNGNSSCVTIFGNSAGSSSVGLLMTTPETKGLFHHAIMQSGSPLAFWALHAPDVDFMKILYDLADHVECKSGDTEERIACMQKVPHQTYSAEYWNPGKHSPSRLNFKPRVDYNLLPDFPEKVFSQGNYHNVPVMTGLVRDEWARNAGWFYKELSNDEIDKQLEDGLNRQSFIDAVHHVVVERFHWPVFIADVIVQLYTNESYINDPYVNRHNYLQLMGDLSMYSPTIKLASLLTKHNTPVYMYQFNEPVIYFSPRWWGAYHGVELDLVFGAPFTGFSVAEDEYIPIYENDKQLSRDVMKIWSDFAKYGNPGKIPSYNNDDKANSTCLPIWEPFQEQRLNYLSISLKTICMKENLKANTLPFWNEVLPKILQIPWEEHYHNPDKSWIHNPYIWIFFTFINILIILLVCIIWKYCQLKHKLIKLKYSSSQARV